MQLRSASKHVVIGRQACVRGAHLALLYITIIKAYVMSAARAMPHRATIILSEERNALFAEFEISGAASVYTVSVNVATGQRQHRLGGTSRVKGKATMNASKLKNGLGCIESS